MGYPVSFYDTTGSENLFAKICAATAICEFLRFAELYRINNKKCGFLLVIAFQYCIIGCEKMTYIGTCSFRGIPRGTGVSILLALFAVTLGYFAISKQIQIHFGSKF